MFRLHPCAFPCIGIVLLLLACAPGLGSGQSVCQMIQGMSGGGGGSTGGGWVHYGSLGGMGGVADLPVSTLANKSGYVGQLYDIESLRIAADPPTVAEGGTRQLAAWQVLDDGSLIDVEEGDVTWSIVDGPLSMVSAGGLVTAARVFADTAATVGGSLADVAGTASLTVANVDPDDFGSYAGDGIDDAWQAFHFGLENPRALPGVDADGDGQDNRLEYCAGVVPTDPLSLLRVRIRQMDGDPGRAAIIFHPRLPGRTYTVRSSPGLAQPSWTALSAPQVSDDGLERTFIDTRDDGAPANFYQVEVTCP